MRCLGRGDPHDNQRANPVATINNESIIDHNGGILNRCSLQVVFPWYSDFAGYLIGFSASNYFHLFREKNTHRGTHPWFFLSWIFPTYSWNHPDEKLNTHQTKPFSWRYQPPRHESSSSWVLQAFRVPRAPPGRERPRGCSWSWQRLRGMGDGGLLQGNDEDK